MWKSMSSGKKMISIRVLAVTLLFCYIWRTNGGIK